MQRMNRGGAPKASKTYLDQVTARARDIRNSNAFEAPPALTSGSVSVAEVKESMREASRANRKAVLILFAVCFATVAFSLCLPFYGVDSAEGGDIYSPLAVLDCWRTWVWLHVGSLFDGTVATYENQTLAALAQAHPDVDYGLVVDRGAATLAVIACGCLLAVSGMLFQTAFRNPLATPTMLGVSDGVTLGTIVFVMLGNASLSADQPFTSGWCTAWACLRW